MSSMARLVQARLACLLGAAILLAAPAAAGAESFPVSSTASSGAGTLRAAIEAANANAGLDTIPIEVTGTVNLETVLPTINDDVDIEGPGQDSLTVRRSSVSSFRIFSFGSETIGSITGLTVSNGRSTSGAGINSFGSLTLRRVTVSGNEAAASGGSQAVAQGAGIISFGPLDMQEVIVTGNTATASGGTSQTVAQQGGVAAFDATLINRSTVSGNTVIANSTGTQVVAQAAGVALLGEPSTLERSTVSGNSASASNGALQTVASAGGILASDGLTLSSSTVTGNSVSSTGSASSANLALLGTNAVRNTIVSNPTGAASCNAPATSAGHNLEDGSSCGFSAPTDLSGANPGLDPVLRANGGPTPTHALLADSIAIDRGNAFGALTDQRGMPRPSDFASVANAPGSDGSDVGAFEAQAPVVGPPPPPPLDLTAPQTRIEKGPPRVTGKRSAKFRFSSNEAGSSFQCKLDKRRFAPCVSPVKLKKVSRDKTHTFEVRATDPAGNVDATPAKFKWRVKPLPPRNRHR
jgi:hypothetical protein